MSEFIRNSFRQSQTDLQMLFLDFSRLRTLGPHMEDEETQLPEEIWPPEKVWMD